MSEKHYGNETKNEETDEHKVTIVTPKSCKRRNLECYIPCSSIRSTRLIELGSTE